MKKKEEETETKIQVINMLKKLVLTAAIMTSIVIAQDKPMTGAGSVMTGATSSVLKNTDKVNASNAETPQSNNEDSFCLPPEADRSFKKSINDTPGSILEQPKFGCAVILCLASPVSTKTCSGVISELYSPRWLARFKPRWPVCKGENINSQVRHMIKVQRSGGCKMTGIRYGVQVFDTTLDNFRKKHGIISNEITQPFFDAIIPYKYQIEKDLKDDTCNRKFTWIAQEVRPYSEADIAEDATVSQLTNAPVCQEEVAQEACIDENDKEAIEKNKQLPENERLPVCGPTCIDKNDKEAIEKNNQLPEDKKLPMCGDCPVTAAFLKKMLGKSTLFTAGNMKKYPQAHRTSIEKFVPALKQAMSKYGINSCYAKAHFLAQTFHEADNYNTTEEYASGKAYNGRKDLGNNRPGDGPRFKGRGLIQLTGRSNYTRYGRANNPTSIAASVFVAADVSGYYWTKLAYAGGSRGCRPRKYGGNINNVIKEDPKNVYRVTRCINGGTRGLASRRLLFNKIVKAWGLK